MSDYASDPAIADTRGKIYDFLLEFMRPALSADCIIYGNQNNLTLPAAGDDYAIFYIQDHQRRGTTIEDYDGAAEVLTLRESSQAMVRVDVYSSDVDRARQRALNLDAVWRSSLSCEFFKGSGAMPLFCDGAQDTTLVDASENYLYRYTVNLAIGLDFSYATDRAGFAELPRVQLNVINRDQDEDAGQEEGGEGRLFIANADVLSQSITRSK